MNRRHVPALLLFLLITISTLLAPPTTATTFKCNTTTTSPLKCHSLIDYISPQNATTTFGAVQTLFAIRNLRSLLGANSLPLSTLPNQTIPPKQSLRIRFPCLCRGGAGVSNKLPVYTVKKGDGLFDIATEVFAGVVTADEIAAVNNVTDKDLIKVGQRLWIPLPCSCDDADGGGKVVHYGHVVAPGSSIDSIAAKFGSSVDVLMGVNGLKNGSGLLAGQVLDVPLRACNSSIRPDSEDSGLLLANGTYAFTAHNCVQCNCDASNNWTLRCQPSGVKPSDPWSTCPATQCEGGNGVMLGNSTASDCGSAICSYAGYTSNQTIFASLDSTCPGASPSGTPPSGNSSGRNCSSKWWNLGLMGLVHLMLLQLCLRL